MRIALHGWARGIAMPLGLIALVLRYLFLVALLWYVVWVLRAMMRSLPTPVREELRARASGHVAPRRSDGPVAAEAPPAASREINPPSEQAVPELAPAQTPGAAQEGALGPTLVPAVSESPGDQWPAEPRHEEALLGEEEPRLPLEVAPVPRTVPRRPPRRPAPPAPHRLAGFELVVDDPARSSLPRGLVVPLRAGLHIGRAADNGLVIDDPAVSRQHAYLGPRGEAWVLVDKGSVNGTFVNGQRLRGPRELTAGDVIEIGGVRLVLRRAGGAGPG
ncbi:MAG: FHA domain-containing protein [Armatimonadetes bacterium]|nr:FHA domain-containing protein [Armatimonadota bacterium]